MVISPVLKMEKILPGPNSKHGIKLEVDSFKKILVRRIECKMCDLIPANIDGLDTKKTSWHRKCYQRFTKNLDRLKPAVMSPLASSVSSLEPCSSSAFSKECLEGINCSSPA